jgi:precorrin-2 dehydrogenase / sirohydrochlorin ferrochelatase
MQSLMIDFKGKKVVIAGGGQIAARKAKVLESEQPDITLIAPDFSEEVLVMARERGYVLLKRKAELSDFNGAFLVILATNDRKANQMFAQSLEPQQLVCVVDEAMDGNALFPATVRRRHLQIAISSNGASPKLTRALKKELELQFDDSWDLYTEFLAKCRNLIKKLSLPVQEKNKMLGEILDDRYRKDEHLRVKKIQELLQLAETKQ